ncbi:insulinase family protein [Maribacter sp. MMG018]|nr:insulinase family protein [Maribacter sp. MMG018]
MKILTKTKIIFCTIAAMGLQQFVNAQNGTDKFSKVKELGGIEEYMYEPNGMNLLLLQDNAAPVVTVQVVYRVGSKHEVPGNTGSTHLLEHLMFKGTTKFHKSKGTSIDSKLTGIGARMNATTWNDRTNYYETIPSDQLELALDIEADRMRNSLLLKEDKEAEMTVVRNEFERGENSPFNVLNKEIWAMAYMAHPYHHATIGWRSDIEKMPIETLRKFYDTYYWPNNATLTIIGDFQKADVFNLVDKYFGKIPKAPHIMPQPYTEEPEQLGPRKTIVKKNGQQSIVSIGYKIPGKLHEDMPALTVLGEILGSGTSSILSKKFKDTGLAYSVFAEPSTFKDTGLFTIALIFDPASSHEDLNNQLLAVIEKIKKEGVDQADVNRVVAKLKAQTILSRDGSGSIASQLNEAIAAGDWTDYVTNTEKLAKVTAEDVKRVAATYLLENQSTTGYFVADTGSAMAEGGPKSSKHHEVNGKYYYRHPDYTDEETGYSVYNIETKVSTTANETPASEEIVNKVKDKKFTRKNIEGIDVVTAKTGVKDFITVSASFPIANYHNTNGNNVVPMLTVGMLDKGTTEHDKFNFSQKLDKLGVNFNINAGTHHVQIGFKCLKKDVNEVVALLAEELRYPLFDAKEFDLLKQQIIGSIKRGISDPATQGSIALSQAIYPEGHPNYKYDVQSTIKNIEKATLNELKTFHSNYFGTKGMHLVVVGDVDTNELYKSLKKAFKGWNGGQVSSSTYKEPSKTSALEKVVTIPQKPSAQLFIGQYTGIKRTDKDYVPFYMATSILGGGFSGRLMRTVRDVEGLTYSIGAGHSGHENSGGHWLVYATFNPSLFQKGLDATMVQIKKWVNEGVTKEELAAKKSNITGSFKVSLETTSGLSRTILSFLQRGWEPDYIDQYPKDVESVTLDQVNAAIKKYIDPDNLIVIKSGSLDKEGKPLVE